MVFVNSTTCELRSIQNAIRGFTSEDAIHHEMVCASGSIYERHRTPRDLPYTHHQQDLIIVHSSSALRASLYAEPVPSFPGLVQGPDRNAGTTQRKLT